MLDHEARIEEQAAEIERLRAVLTEALGGIEQRDDRARELEAALRETADDTDGPHRLGRGAMVRRARAVLAVENQEEA